MVSSALDPSQPFARAAIQWNVFPPPAARPPRKTKNKAQQNRNRNRNRAGNSERPNGKEQQKQQQQKQKQKQQQQQSKPLPTDDGTENNRSEPPGTEFWRQKQQQYSYTYPYQVGDPVLMLIPHHHQQQRQQQQQQQQQQRQQQQQQQRHEAHETDVDIDIDTTDTVHPNKKQKFLSPEPSNEPGAAAPVKVPAADDGNHAVGAATIANQTKDNRNKTNYLIPVPGWVVRITGEGESDGNDNDNENDNTNGWTSERLVHVQLAQTTHSRHNQIRNSGGGDHGGTIRILSPKEQRKLLQPRFGGSTSRLCPSPPPPSLPQKFRDGTVVVVVVLVEETLPFRQVVRFQLHSDASATDRVLEIGCSTGELSRTIWDNQYYSSSSSRGESRNRTGTLTRRARDDGDDDDDDEVEGGSGPSCCWIGMDHSQEMIDKCAQKLRKHPLSSNSTSHDESESVVGHNNNNNNNNNTTKLVKVDALAEPQRAVREVGKFPPTVVLIDIGGNRECAPVLKTLSWVLESFGGTNCSHPTNERDGNLDENTDQRNKSSSSCSNTNTNNNTNNNNNNNNTLRLVIVKSRALVRQLISDCADASQSCEDHSNFNDKERTTTNAVRVSGLDASTGLLANGSEWFVSALRRLSDPTPTTSSGNGSTGTSIKPLFKHPLKAPMVLSPVDETTPICRYHNYHKDGCRLHSNSESQTSGNVADGTTAAAAVAATATIRCPFDHDHCHACRERGHVAKHCPRREARSCY